MLKKEMDYYIGIKNTDGIRVIKCNNSSCLENAGELLLEGYSKKSEVEKLINLGEIDELMETYKETKEESVFVKGEAELFIEEFTDEAEMLEYADGETIYVYHTDVKDWFYKAEDSEDFELLKDFVD